MVKPYEFGALCVFQNCQCEVIVILKFHCCTLFWNCSRLVEILTVLALLC